MRNPVQNQKGIALIATLMLMVLGFAIVAILFGLSTQETKLTRLEQGYTTALNAATAGTDLFLYMRQNSAYTPPSAPFGTSPNNGNCLNVKMNNITSAWSGAQWSGCPQASTTTAPSAISSNPTDSPDITLTLSNYTVYIKVIDNWITQPTKPNAGPCEFNGCNYYTVISQAVSPDLSEHAEVFFVYRWGS
ncbi:MAG: hypothetical protein ACLQVJ_23510 [Syntrophobacteraceae bacterium]